jgi:hypothetical protein
MNERSGPASPLRKNNVSCRKASRHYGGQIPQRDREHELDRMIAAATWRRERAKAGRGFRFELPPSLRKGAA